MTILPKVVGNKKSLKSHTKACLNQMMQKLSWIECESAKNLVKSNSFERLTPHFISNWIRDGLRLVPISSQTIFAMGLATHHILTY